MKTSAAFARNVCVCAHVCFLIEFSIYSCIYTVYFPCVYIHTYYTHDTATCQKPNSAGGTPLLTDEIEQGLTHVRENVAMEVLLPDLPIPWGLKVWSIYGFCIRIRNCGFGYIPHIWVLGPLGIILAWTKASNSPTSLNRAPKAIIWCTLRLQIVKEDTLCNS